MRILDMIHTPADLKRLHANQLAELADELRVEMIAATSVNGGHLASSLGATEIIIALHRVLDCPHDRIVFDVGHQAYAHKLLTGRKDRFYTLRTHGGISGFPKIDESPYDVHNSGHASDALSTALGLAYARDLNGGSEHIVAVVGDGAISAGLAFEAMNQAGQLHTKMTVILNDNAMSISRNVGALSRYLAYLRTDERYLDLNERLRRELEETDNPIQRFVLSSARKVKGSVRRTMVPGMFFEELGLKYLGPVDGHNIAQLESIIRAAQEVDDRPVLVHAITEKGHGYQPAAAHPDIFHGVGPFDIDTGAALKKPGPPKYTKVFSDALVAEAARDEDIVAITAAMPAGTGLQQFGERYPRRFLDVGICEEHAVTFASGLALAGKKPVVAIYSTFLQRAYDEIIINVALQNQHVVFCIDRAGIVGADGPTHHGAFDIAYLRSIPNMRIFAPSSGQELVDALHTALALDGPVALRYPRGSLRRDEQLREPQMLTVGESVTVREGGDVAILALGTMVDVACDAAELLAEQGVCARVVDMRWAKPIDTRVVADAASLPLLVTMEEGTTAGGFGAAVLESLSERELCPPTLCIGLPDAFVEQGSIGELHEELGLTAPAVASRIQARLTSLKNA